MEASTLQEAVATASGPGALEDGLLIAVLVVAGVGIAAGILFARGVLRVDKGSSAINAIADRIRAGARTFLRRQLRAIRLAPPDLWDDDLENAGVPVRPDRPPDTDSAHAKPDYSGDPDEDSDRATPRR